ncbi:MAG: SCO family protein [Rhodocyclales bacterium]|nr:SCO family protein [Rhodocyclales bacterium]
MKATRRRFLPLLSIALLGTATLWWGSDGFTAFTAEAARRQSVLAEPRPLPMVGLEDQDGRRFTLGDYAGRLLAIEFIYTQCNSICYSLGTTFRQLHDSVPTAALGRDLALLSISFDPQHDGPEQLREYGQRFGADGANWRIARPLAAAELPALLAAFGVVAIPDRLGGFEHNAAIHLVGRDNRLRQISDIDAAAPFVAAIREQL